MKKNVFDRYYYLWSVSIVVCLLLTFFSLIFVSCAKTGDSDVKTTSTPASPSAQPADAGTETADPGAEPSSEVSPVPPAESNSPLPSQNADPTFLGETEDMGQEYVNRFVFLGDSTTYGLGAYEVVDKNQVWTPKSGTLTLDKWSYTAIVYPDTGEEILLPEAVADKKPEYMMITLGINGISFMDEENFKSEYTKLVQAVQENSPDTKIIINSIYPVAASYKYLDEINNTKIATANEWLKSVAQETGVRYLDSASVLLGSDGWLPENLLNGSDGMHMNENGYQLVIQYLRTHAYK
jgi:lysophospholipase L1-like esterase